MMGLRSSDGQLVRLTSFLAAGLMALDSMEVPGFSLPIVRCLSAQKEVSELSWELTVGVFESRQQMSVCIQPEVSGIESEASILL